MNKSGAYAWLAAGAVTVGLGVAGMDCAAVAAADTGTSVASSGVSRPAATGAPSTKRSAVSVRKSGGATAAVQSQAHASRIARAANDSATLNPLQSLARELQYIFNNPAPTIQAGTQVQGSGGAVVGTVSGQSNNGFVLTYSLGQKPQYGIAEVNAGTGAYIYTPNAGVPVSSVVDEFTIVANNGTAAQLPGPLGLTANLLHGVAVGIGASSAGTADAHIAVSLTGQTLIGDPAAKKQYWQQATWQLSRLAAVRMVIGQLTGTMPNWDGLITKAKVTDSVVKTLPRTVTQKQTGQPGSPAKMYDPDSKYEEYREVVQADANELLQKEGFVVTGTYYSKSGGLDDALANVALALYQGKSVIMYPGTDLLNIGNAPTVLGIDFTKQQVYLNDGEFANGQNKIISLSEFARFWGPTFRTVVAEKAATSV